MDTNGPRDLKWSLKLSPEYPLRDQRCSQQLFFQNRGLKRPLSNDLLGSGATFWPFVKNGGLLDHNFEKIIFWNIFDHKEDTLGIILSPILGL